MTGYVLSKQAEKDIEAIFTYGINQFGIKKSSSYLDSLDETLKLIVSNPKIARVRPELDGEVRAYPFYAHIILYEIAGNNIFILSIRSARENWLS
jgi:toxin ParE1/3/4